MPSRAFSGLLTAPAAPKASVALWLQLIGWRQSAVIGQAFQVAGQFGMGFRDPLGKRTKSVVRCLLGREAPQFGLTLAGRGRFLEEQGVLTRKCLARLRRNPRVGIGPDVGLRPGRRGERGKTQQG